MKLIKPTKKYEQSWKAALAEFQAEERKGFWNWEKEPDNLDDYMKQTRNNEKGKGLSESFVPSTTYWLIDNDEFVGHTNIRHKLNEHYRKIGGHIGYYIRPSARKKGYGTKILKLALKKARRLGLKKVLITCDESNIASQKVIEKNKGKFQDKIPSDPEPKLRYWIEL
ncbi:GNAT family N-acetyltransferase [Candidatus Peregrinibacteria bacterium]|nr:GNAT family N-acetyltransferase [Candidatus Peregrinibacteria bacterium]